MIAFTPWIPWTTQPSCRAVRAGMRVGPTQAPAAGVTAGRFIENINWRAPAGDPTDPGVDPNIKPMYGHETLLGSDFSLTPRLGVEIRWARKRLDQAIDDMSVD